MVKYILMDYSVYGGLDVHGIYSERADAEADFYDFCYDEVYAIMMTSSPVDVTDELHWD